MKPLPTADDSEDFKVRWCSWLSRSSNMNSTRIVLSQKVSGSSPGQIILQVPFLQMLSKASSARRICTWQQGRASSKGDGLPPSPALTCVTGLGLAFADEGVAQE